MNPIIMRDAKALPVTVYRMELKVVNDQPSNIFVELPFKVLSTPAERIATDHIVNVKDEVTDGKYSLFFGLIFLFSYFNAIILAK